MERLYTEVSISEDEDSNEFQKLVNRLVSEFDAKIINHVHDLDTNYIDIEIQGEKLTLHRQTFMGILIFPTALEDASQQANVLVKKVGLKLKNPGQKRNTP